MPNTTCYLNTPRVFSSLNFFQNTEIIRNKILETNVWILRRNRTCQPPNQLEVKQNFIGEEKSCLFIAILFLFHFAYIIDDTER